MSNNFLELELKELDKKYIMKAYLLTTGKADMYVIDPIGFKEPVPNKPLKIGEKIYSSLQEGLKEAGKNNNTMVDPMVDKEDLPIINKYYKQFGGYVTLL